MATTLEMWLSGLALICNSFVILVMFFVGEVVLSPIIGALEGFITGPQPVPMSDISYLIPSIWAILIIMEIVCVISFLVTSARRSTVDDYGVY